MAKSCYNHIVLIATTVLLFLLSVVPVGAKTNLSLWIVWGPSVMKDGFDQAVAKYQKLNPNIKINVTGFAFDIVTYQEKLLTSIAANSTPDMAVIDVSWLPRFHQMNACIPYDSFANADRQVRSQDLFEGLRKAVEYKGVALSLPLFVDQPILYNNVSMFAKAGIPGPPATWSELQDYGLKLTRDTNGDGKLDTFGLAWQMGLTEATIYFWLPFLWQNGGEVLNSALNKSTFNSRQGIESLSFMVDALYKHQWSPRLGQPSNFFTSKTGMGMHFPQDALGMPKGFQYDVAMLPAGKAGRATPLGGWHMTVMRYSKKAKQAQDFVRFLAQPENLAAFNITLGQTAPMRSVAKVPAYANFVKGYKPLQVANEQAEFIKPRPVTPKYTSIAPVIIKWLNEALTGKVEPSAALDSAARQVDALLAR